MYMCAVRGQCGVVVWGVVRAPHSNTPREQEWGDASAGMGVGGGVLLQKQPQRDAAGCGVGWAMHHPGAWVSAPRLTMQHRHPEKLKCTSGLTQALHKSRVVSLRCAVVWLW